MAPAVHTWTGAVSTLWSNDANWIGGSPADDPSAALIFPASPTRLSSNNNLLVFGPPLNPPSWVAQSITIQGSGYTISGNVFYLGAAGITTTNATGANTIACDITTPDSGFRTVTVVNAGTNLNLAGQLRDGFFFPTRQLGLAKTGAGTLWLTAANSHSLGTRLNGGPLFIGNNTALGSGPFTFNNGSLQATTQVTLANPFTIAGPNDIEGFMNITFSGAGTLNVPLHTSNASVTTVRFNGPLSGPGGFVQDGPGRALLANPANSYAGATVVNGGILRLAAGNVIPNASAVSVWSPTGRLDLAGFGETIGSLSGNGVVTLGLPGFGLTTGVLNTSTTYSGSIYGEGLVQKQGTGTWTLTGPFDAYQLVVWAGTLDVRTGLVVTHVAVIGGTVRVDASGYVYATGNYVQGPGRTLLVDGGIYATLVDVQNGTLDGNGYIVGNLRNDGTINVGGTNAAGYLYVLGGNYMQTAGGVLNVELRGLDIVTQYDFLYVEGTASLAGTLNVSRLSGYVPNPGDYFLPLYSGGLTSGVFGSITGLRLGSGRELLPYSFANGLVPYAG